MEIKIGRKYILITACIFLYGLTSFNLCSHDEPSSKYICDYIKFW